mgnify:CR=1 FL=1
MTQPKPTPRKSPNGKHPRAPMSSPVANKSDATRKPHRWQKGESGNPQGAPRRGESWAEIIKRFGELTAGEAAQMSLELAQKFLNIGEGVTLKQAVVMRVYGALLFDPDARLLNAFMDRAEGKVAQPITVDDISKKSDSELVDEFTDLVYAARARTGADAGGGTGAAGADDDPPAA